MTTIAGGAICYRLLIGPLAWRARPVSKVNTAAQLAFVLGAMSSAAHGIPPAAPLALVGAVIVATTILSGADYVWSWSLRAWRVKHGGGA